MRRGGFAADAAKAPELLGTIEKKPKSQVIGSMIPTRGLRRPVRDGGRPGIVV
jgi:hypothetical protein